MSRLSILSECLLPSNTETQMPFFFLAEVSGSVTICNTVNSASTGKVS